MSQRTESRGAVVRAFLSRVPSSKSGVVVVAVVVVTRQFVLL